MSRPLTKEEEEELLRQFEKMLEEDDDEEELELTDFAYYNQVRYPDNDDLEYPEEEPPPIPKAAKCSHKKRKKVIISHNLKYWYCPDCKEDLGDA